jgi:hypothetical protein
LYQPSILEGEPSGLLTHIAATESVWLCVLTKNQAPLEATDHPSSGASPSKTISPVLFEMATSRLYSRESL